MNEHTSLVYHQATFDLIREKPIFSPKASEVLDRLEQNRGIILPAAVREWYSLEGAVEILNRFPSCGNARKVEELGAINTYWSNKKQYEVDLLQQGLLWIMRELQGICSWSIQLDGSDNPPVLVSFNDTFADWDLYIETFSSFTYICAWDKLLVGEDQLFGWKRDSLLPSERTFFQKHFQEGPRSYNFPEEITYRYYSGSQRILIHNGKDQSGFYFYAPDDDDLKRLVTTVLQCDSLKGEMHLNRNGLTTWKDIFPEEDY